MRVIFSDRAYAAVLAETTEKVTTETGGLFLGAVRDGTWYIIETIDPGPKAIFQVAYFEYDRKYTQHLINKVANLYDQPLTLIGLWHRHPGSFDRFSSTDNGTNAKYAAMRREGALSALVNIDPNFRFTMYHVAQPCHYEVLPYAVGSQLIPEELLAYKPVETYFRLMDRQLYGGGAADPMRLETFMEQAAPQLERCPFDGAMGEQVRHDADAAELLADSVVDDLTFMTETAGVPLSAAFRDGCLLLTQEDTEPPARLRFAALADGTMVLSYGDDCYFYRTGVLAKAFAAAQSRKQEKEQQKRAKVDAIVRLIRTKEGER